MAFLDAVTFEGDFSTMLGRLEKRVSANGFLRGPKLQNVMLKWRARR
jgi:hypothetical protein